jgi:serine/threonine protein kinase
LLRALEVDAFGVVDLRKREVSANGPSPSDRLKKGKQMGFWGQQTATETCQNCGASLGAQGECTACLLQLGVSQYPEAQDESPRDSLPDLEVLNRQFPQLEIRRLIGRGGMGAIYQARQTNLDRDVALKIIASEVSGDPSFAERFEREAKTLARLSHSNIVTVYDFGRTEDGLAYLIMEYVDGINLREAMASNSIGADDALAIVSTICDALQYAHDKGVVHRDIKPENILLSEEGSVKVADFGIAKIVDESIRTPTLTATRQVLGSMHYLAPEHLEAPGQVDHRVDLYALGVILYELLTGELPLGRYEPPSRLQNRATARIDEIVMRTLSRRPGERYQTASDLQKDLSDVHLEGNAPCIEPLPQNADVQRASQAPRVTHAVPFSAESHGGFGELVGMLRVVDGKTLKLEYRARDSFFGTIQSDTRTVEIPLHELLRLEFRPSVFGSRLRLVADSIESLKSLPGAETGQVTLKIKSEDGEAARAIVKSAGFANASIFGNRFVANSLQNPVLSHPNWVPFSILSIFCAIFNAGMLAVILVVASSEVGPGLEFNAIAITTSVLFGPIAALQLVNGLLGLTIRPVGFARAAAIISMLPVAPAWLFSGPLGLWGYYWLRDAEQINSTQPASISQNSQPASESQGWGATTMMFIRESRWGRLVALGNVLAAIFAVGALAVYRSGVYPTELSYEVVNRSIPEITLHEHIRNRLGSEVSVGGYDGKVMLDTRAFARERVIDLLRIENEIQLTWLVRLSDDSEADSGEISRESDVLNAESQIPIAKDLTLQSGFTTPDGTLGVSVKEMIPLQRADFSDLESRNSVSNRLQMRLTKLGSEKLTKAAPADKDSYLPVLVVDGLVIGYLRDGTIIQREVEFEFASGEDFNVRSIEAALRGPALGTELELMD